MSEQGESDRGSSVEDKQRRLADAFGRELDPLLKYESQFENASVDVFELFIEDVLEARNLNSSTKEAYACTFNQWKKHMEKRRDIRLVRQRHT